MELLTILINGVGNGIAKAILNTWLSEHDIEKEIGKNIIGMLSSSSLDIITQRRGKRQLEEISENISKALQPIFRSATSISKERKKEIANLAEVAINNLEITPDFLITNEYEPHKIKKILHQYTFLPNEEHIEVNFLDDEAKLFDRILSEAAHYIVVVTPLLPSFTSKTFSTILNSQNKLVQSVNSVIEEFEKIRKGSLLSKEEYLEFEEDYRKVVISKLDELELFGIENVGRTSKKYKLSTAYIRLDIESQVQVTDETFLKGNLINIEEALTKSNKIIIKGDAGSGKTTLLKWIAIKSSGFKLEDELEIWNESTPFFIQLRKFSNKNLPSPDNWVSFISQPLNDEMPKKWITNKLKKGKGIILLDGIDEVSEKQREDVREWIKEIDTIYPNNKWIVTARPYAVKDGWLQSFNFLEALIHEMRIEDIELFVDKWHQSVKEAENRIEDKTELDNLSSKLKLTIRSNPNIRKLVTNPLLCAMVCALHRDRFTHLPSEKTKLYEACINMFLRRDLARNILIKDYVSLGIQQKIVLLSDLAYTLTKNVLTEIDISRVDKRFNFKLRSLQDVQGEIEGLSIRKYFVERSGILRQPTNDKIDFPHRTFQEYLAAVAFLDEGDIEIFQQYTTDDNWREVIQLACGMARTKEANNIIELIIKQGDDRKEQRTELYLLAASCFENTVKANNKTKKQVLKRLKQLVPPSNLGMAKELAKHGDLVVPFLKYKKSYNLKQIQPIIRALSLIGTESAISTLEVYTTDKRKNVKKYILDNVKYTSNPARFLKNISLEYTKIYIDRNMPFEVLKNLPKLDTIDFSKEIEIPYDKIPYSEKVTTIVIGKKTIRDISFLNKIPNLTNLSLSLSHVKNLSFLFNKTKLSNLTIRDMRNVELPNNLSNLQNLIGLKLIWSKLTSINGISGIEKLTTLELKYTEIENQDIILELNNLKLLNIQDCKHVDLKMFQKAIKLEKIVFSGNKISNFSSLKNCSSLKEILINNRFNNKTLKFDIEGLLELEQLEKLEIYDSKFKDLSSIKNLKNLKELHLSTLSENFDFLKELQKLEVLEINIAKEISSPINLDVISSLKNIENLNIFGKQLENFQCLKKLSNLKILKIGMPRNADEILNLDFIPSLKSIEELDIQMFPKQLENCDFLLNLNFKTLKKLVIPKSTPKEIFDKLRRDELKIWTYTYL